MNKINQTRSRIIAIFFLVIFMPSVFPLNLLYASNNGPKAPEASSFESVNATDMVNLSSGDMSYVLPLMDVDGFPITLSYHGGIPADLESSWTGLGWNINAGAINRNLNSTPDDWKEGRSLDFIFYQDTSITYTVNVGIGIPSVMDIGVGASWGPNKALSGSVFASVGVVSASISTDGNYSLGVGVGGKLGGGTFGGSINISGNVSGGKASTSANLGGRTADGMTVGLGIDLDTGNTSLSVGASTAKGSGASLSASNFSSGDWDISSKGFYIPIKLGIFSFGFGVNTTTQTLAKAYTKFGYGILYSKDAVNTKDNPLNPEFYDEQDMYRYTDMYEQTLPQPEAQFVADYDADREKLNFVYAGYDNYDVSTIGLSGTISPRILQASTLFGLGYKGPDAKSPNGDGKLQIFNHNTGTTQKTFGTGNASTDIKFYFNGQFTQNVAVEPISLTGNYSSLPSNTINNTILYAGVSDTKRYNQGNYVEVYTNQQIKNGAAKTAGLLEPIDPNSDGNNLTALNRNGSEYIPDGIGGYKITAPDGKTYHFSQPVYHFEQVERNILKDDTENFVSDKRQYTPYATHWLLTAITGPDFVDTNNNNVADIDDYGYWVRMDYGKWSDGYVWRNPTDKNIKDYNSATDEKIAKDDFGTYQFGRKQLFYLDKIVTPTHTAFFVKDLRHDSVGSDLNYKFYTNYSPFQNNGTGTGQDDKVKVIENENGKGVQYKAQMQLMLEKIILVKNNVTVSKGQPTNNLALAYPAGVSAEKSYSPNYNPSGDFASNGYNGNISINNESGVYDVNDFKDFDYGKAIKVVDMEYNYNLAVQSPGTVQTSKNPNKGRLNLKTVTFLGRDNFNYMPPYRFEYKGEYISPAAPGIKFPQNIIKQKAGILEELKVKYGVSVLTDKQKEIPVKDLRAKDDWGFLKEGETPDNPDANASPDAWSMTKITTPTGGTIEIEHEEDDYLTEAFSRRFWRNGLQFTFDNKQTIPGDYIDTGHRNPGDLNYTLDMHVKKDQDLIDEIKFTDYFDKDSPVFLDFFLCQVHRTGSYSHFQRIDINNGNNSKGIKPILVTEQEVVFRLDRRSYMPEMSDENDLFGNLFRLNKKTGIYDFTGESRACSEADFYADNDTFNLIYKLLANRVPKDKTGGGLRVKSITVKDENNNQYKTAYYYNKPGTNKNKNVGDYKSSGITSYSPIRGTKFVPYQSELPSPGVMYEYVTMETQDQSGQLLNKTVYNFYVLQNVLNIFDPNIEMKDADGTVIFKATVNPKQTYNIGGEYRPCIPHEPQEGYCWRGGRKYFDSQTMKLDVNTSLIGQFRAITEYNALGQILSKTQKKYLSGYDLKAKSINRGSIKESFHTMKSIFATNNEGGNVEFRDRQVAISSKEEYGSVLQETKTTTPHGYAIERYDDTDPYTGAFLSVEKQLSDGTQVKETKIPAYRKYPSMGSKVLNSNNANMLTQTAAEYAYIMNGGVWKETGVGITTWNNNWTYNNIDGTTSSPSQNKPIWRKHKTFVWNGSKDVNGIFDGYGANDDGFDWNLGVGTKWKQVSEITAYDHYSAPLEIKDINGNFAATKMGDKDTKIMTTGNAGYHEMFYAGAENTDNTNTWLEPEVKISNADRSPVLAHTGGYSVATTSSSTFGVTLKNAQHRAGKYKVSVWVAKANLKNSVLKVNGAIIEDNKFSEITVAGDWVLKSAVVTLPATDCVINLNSKDGTTVYYDDLMIRPLASSMSGYVYNEWDELTYIIGNNGLASKYEYDKAGRLTRTYTEVVDDSENGITGGFKLTSSNTYNNRWLR